MGTVPVTACTVCSRDLEHGHVCRGCTLRLVDDLVEIPRLAALASTEPRTGRGTGRAVPASRPPIDLDGIDPALALVDVGSGPTTVLEVCESWERLLRQERAMAPYGPASASRLAVAGLSPAYGHSPTLVLLRGCTGILAAHVDWMTTEPTWPVDDLSAEMSACVRVLRHFDPDRQPSGTVVACPTVTIAGPCDRPLRVTSVDDVEVVRCPRCGTSRTTAQLLRLGVETGDAWVDVEAAAVAVGVTARTIQRWARTGCVRRQGSRYALSDVRTQASG